jgi:lipopolysaccharide biosynthesis glycosyltransferase
MKEKKYVICIATSTDFAIATAVLIYSLKKNLRVYNDCDVKVLYNNLDSHSQNLIRKVKEDVIFEGPKDNSFYKHIDKTIYGKDNYDVYLSFECLHQDEYQKSIYLDADMLCIKDFSGIILGNEGGISWRIPNLGTIVVGERLLGSETYYKFIDAAIKHKFVNNPGGDQDTLRFLYTVGSDVQPIHEKYNFQAFGCGGPGTNKNFLDQKDDVRVIHYSGRRKPWGGVYDGRSLDEKNCMSYPYMCFHSEAIRIWYRYYEEFKITHISGNTKFELYQVQNGTIIEDTLVAL